MPRLCQRVEESSQRPSPFTCRLWRSLRISSCTRDYALRKLANRLASSRRKLRLAPRLDGRGGVGSGVGETVGIGLTLGVGVAVTVGVAVPEEAPYTDCRGS